MKNIQLLVLLLTLTLWHPVHAQNSIFPSGSRVCFVGNSITNNGEFHRNILLYHITRFPECNVAFFNCGISGDVTGGILKRMDSDILCHKPTHVVIMIGMNDMTGSLFGSQLTQNRDTLQKREAAFVLYKTNLEKIVNILLDKDIRVILQTPSIYDQTAVLPTTLCLGRNDALKQCANFVNELSIKYKLDVVDYWSLMMRINTEKQKTDNSFTITSKDRVHPDATGHLVMSYQFLKTMGAPQTVSNIVLDGKVKSSNAKSINCSIISIETNKTSFKYSIKESSLPFPMVSSQEKGLMLVPFCNELNVHQLKVPKLKQGKYELAIDGMPIDTFSAEELSKGVDLAKYPKIPQYQQAIKVREVLNKLWRLESNLRGIKFIEYNQYFKDCPDKENLSIVQHYMDSIFSKKYTNPYFKQKLNDYLVHKPEEQLYIVESEQLRAEALKQAKPKVRQFQFTKL